ncbi:probable glutathione S-transferase [Pistacia vera]|uniref:probable glutathione S-transferase n=1 Tax=Pistacia vera TaxID=55513 RepID=UPI001262FC6B|nr:probable glutathione S-transferase [Pistacia vera]
MARFWVKFIDEKYGKSLERREDRKEAVEEACEHLKTLENELKVRSSLEERILELLILLPSHRLWVGVIEEASGYAVKFFTEEKFPYYINGVMSF